MVDAAMSAHGFTVAAKNLREWEGKKWSATEHTLDRVYRRDGRPWGAEIKNTLQYIEPDELTVKIEMCEYLGLRPLLITRFAPKNYINQVFKAGGFTLVFDRQLYPFGFSTLAEEIRKELGLPVDCPAGVPEGHLTRFENWHAKNP